MLQQDAPPSPPLTIRDIKQAIEKRVPLHYRPLPIDGLMALEWDLVFRQDCLRHAVPPAPASLIGRAKTLVKKVLRRVLRWLFVGQVEFNSSVLEYNRETTQLLMKLDQNICELFDALAVLKRQVVSLSTGNQEIDRKITALDEILLTYRLRLKSLAAPPSTPASEEAPPSRSRIDYFRFENRFRGPREAVLQKQSVYLDYFRDLDKVLDIGCGRGEFVELLNGEGIAVWGIDSNPDMVAFCQERGLPVSLEDGGRYLEQLENDSLGGIFLAQLVEHLPPDVLARLCEQCWAKLRPGGLVLLETINPVCPVALADFFLDPTHVRPVHAELLRFLLECSGFRDIEYIFSASESPTAKPVVKTREDPNFDIKQYLDYASLGRN
jgi:SAM-dependent methyltransferase